MRDLNRISGLLLVALVSLGCTDPVAPDIDRLAVSLTLSKAVITEGEATELRAVVANESAHDLTFRTNACTIVFDMYDVAGQRFVEPIVCNDIGLEHVLRPGESLQRTVMFDGTGWISSGGGQGPGPGDYTVRAGVSLAFRSPSPRVGLTVHAAEP